MGPQVEEEGVEAGAQPNGGEHTKTNPVATPDHLALHPSYILEEECVCGVCVWCVGVCVCVCVCVNESTESTRIFSDCNHGFHGNLLFGVGPQSSREAGV